MKKSYVSIYLIFAFTATIVMRNRYTCFHINDYRVHFLFDFFAAASFIIISGHIFKKLQSIKIILFTFILS